MLRIGVLLGAALVIASVTSRAQDQPGWIQVVVNGKAVMGFLPSEAASGEQSRGVCSKITEPNSKTASGEPIRALRLTGSKDGEAYRVRIFAIVPASAGEGTEGLCEAGTGYKRVVLDELLIESGQEITVQKMKDAGMAPWILRAVPR